MQSYSIFHSLPESLLKLWHQPYVGLFEGFAPVLDVGCGLGYFADLLRDKSIDCVGLDVDPAMVAASQSRHHTAFLGNHAAVTQLRMQFGGIHISHVVEHLWGEELIDLINQCRESLRDGGRLIIRTPNWEVAEVRRRVFWLDHTHRRPYGLDCLVRILTDSGFAVHSAGHEPYGLKDLYLVASKGTSAGAQPTSAPAFAANPFPKPSVQARLKGWVRNYLREERRLSVRRR